MRRKVHLHILFYEESNLVLREITVLLYTSWHIKTFENLFLAVGEM